MQQDNFDTFISYRRSTGAVIASRIHDNLIVRGFNPFFDITEMKAGRFDEQLKNRIVKAVNFILVLSKNALDRCTEENDWVRQEIVFAISHHLNIILVKERDFLFPQELPAELADLHLYQTLIFDEDNFYQSMDEICKLMIHKVDEFSVTHAASSISKKINLSGDYITIYEDVEDGRVVVRKAPATLNQHGKRVSGHTAFSPNQSWVIKGSIYNQKRIAGMYYAKDVLDEGFGTFFLEIKSNDILSGFWSGYDNVNQMVTSGRYLFRRKLTTIATRPMQRRDIPEVCDIANEQLGKGYVSESQLAEHLLAADASLCICAVDKRTSKVVGFSISKMLDSAEECEAGKDLLDLKYADKIGYLKTIAVDKEYAGYGVGSQLVDASIKVLVARKATFLVSTAWKHSGIINIGNILERFGFVNKLEVANYWYESSLKEGYSCPQCGNPCYCSCVVYTKKV